MRITVLGKSPAWPDADGACSGYLVEDAGVLLLVDCGNGVFGKLRRFCDYVDLDAVVVSHMHADHMLDLVPYAYALTYAPRQQPVPVPPWPGTDTPARPRLMVPEGGLAALRAIVGTWGNELLVENAFASEEYAPSDGLEVGPLRLSFHPVPHFMATCAIEVRGSSGARFTYAADHSPTEELDLFAHDTDLLFLEATLPRPERDGPRGHLTPSEAGQHATRVGARRLVLTHISDELDATWAQAEARRTYDGPVEVAREGAAYEI